jgi:hypothetical protein
MKILDRAKQIILKPKEEWVVIDQESTSVMELVTAYLFPLALIPAVASLIGYGFIRFHSVGFGLKYGILYFINFAAGAFLTAWIIDALAPSFGSTKDFRKAFQLVVYSYTPMMVAGVVMIFPSLSPLMLLAGLYSLFILYLGFKPLMKTPDDKVITYFIVSLVVLVVIYIILSTVLTRIMIGHHLSVHGLP